MSKDLSEKEKMILENLYRCRDLELNNLWQKSIFLGPFLILCFTGYGFLLDKLFERESFSLKTNILCIVLCIVSAIFSMLWIYMFKGSKAQYELCERAIANYEQKELNIPYGYAMGTLRYNEIEFDDNLLSTKAGKFSPSKINILIGQVSLWLWIYCFLFHLGISFEGFKQISIIIVITIIILVFFLIAIKSKLLSYIVPSFLLESIKSSYLFSSDEERCIRDILKRKNKDGKEDKNKDENEEDFNTIISNNNRLLEYLQKIYGVDDKVIFTKKEKIYLDACRYLVELGKIDISKQEEPAPTTQEEPASTAQEELESPTQEEPASTAQEELESPTQEESVSTSSIDLKQELSSLASALGIEKKRMKELNKYIDEKYQK